MKRLLAILALLLACSQAHAMQLYWKNTNVDGLWFTTGNWWEDQAGTNTPHGALPISGDSCSYATGETATVSITMGTVVDLGAGSCNLTLVITGGTNEIQSGTFSGTISNHCLISGGVFNALVTNGDGAGNNGVITGGTFAALDNNVGSTITAGTFTQGGHNFGSVYGGVWMGGTLYNRSGGVIFGGLCQYDEVNDAGGIINGGVFPSGIANAGTINGGIFTSAYFTNTGTINGGQWWLSGQMRVNGVQIKASSDPVPASTFKSTLVTSDTLLGGL